MKPTEGRKPKTRAQKLRVQFRNGHVAGPYTCDMLRWTDTGDDYDVVGVEPWGKAA